MNHLTVETEDAFTSVLELAANNDVEGLRRLIEQDPSCIDEIGLWYCRQNGSKQMVNVHRTPLMVAASYGCIDVMRLILSLSDVDVNFTCGIDKSTALHCAASGGAVNAGDIVNLLLAAGADPNLVDANANRPADVIVVPPKLQDVKSSLEELLGSVDGQELKTSSASDFTSSAMKLKLDDLPVTSPSEKKEYPIDPSLPDIKNGIYSTDEFRMYSFKVRPCSRAYSHDWTECPFVHPGENARRRDPRKYHYSCVPCPDFRKGACRRGDMCEYAHGVFEGWLHPAQYRTRLCKDGTSCARRVCFFAHTAEELRPLYASTGSAVLSPRSMDYAAAMSLLPGSPTSMSVMSPSPFTPPMSPSGNGPSSGPWSQPNVPTLQLPRSSFQSSRLRSSLSARDIAAEDYSLLPDFEQLSNMLSSANSNSLNHLGRMRTLIPSNLDDLFSAEGSSPRYADQTLGSFYSPKHKSAMLNPFQQQQSMLSPINTNLSPKNAEPPLLQSPYGVPSSGRMSPRNVEPISPMSSCLSMLAEREKQRQFCSLSSWEIGSNSSPVVGSPANSWAKWGYSNGGESDRGVRADEFGKLCESSSFEVENNGEEPDLSWVQSLVKESPTEIKENIVTTPVTGTAATAITNDGLDVKTQIESVGHLGAWLEQVQLDQLVAQQN